MGELYSGRGPENMAHSFFLHGLVIQMTIQALKGSPDFFPSPQNDAIQARGSIQTTAAFSRGPVLQPVHCYNTPRL